MSAYKKYSSALTSSVWRNLKDSHQNKVFHNSVVSFRSGAKQLAFVENTTQRDGNQAVQWHDPSGASNQKFLLKEHLDGFVLIPVTRLNSNNTPNLWLRTRTKYDFYSNRMVGDPGYNASDQVYKILLSDYKWENGAPAYRLKDAYGAYMGSEKRPYNLSAIAFTTHQPYQAYPYIIFHRYSSGVINDAITGSQVMQRECCMRRYDEDIVTEASCSVYQEQSGACDSMMMDFCKTNPETKDCSCLRPGKADLIPGDPYKSSIIQANPYCFDGDCIYDGYATNQMKTHQCPNLTICIQDWNVAGSSNILDTNIQKQDCSTEVQAPVIQTTNPNQTQTNPNQTQTNPNQTDPNQTTMSSQPQQTPTDMEKIDMPDNILMWILVILFVVILVLGVSVMMTGSPSEVQLPHPQPVQFTPQMPLQSW
jgi:hypothetical protein